jgi:hypothetical protein
MTEEAKTLTCPPSITLAERVRRRAFGALAPRSFPEPLTYLPAGS